ncbi:hypothetical protein A2Z33_06945 [Candidatus Gottesmanbacteria bacterium RBG_16_52_11]|uniref:Large ribosomal subunit protein uL29 n=1 Tax=Candidatus Gottesmanbacteria bacterium RBG_16_52_11 TaxID=1798374 RepID=A0A1F5YXS8_9BACT|nr:MAG: hypothetical protein A2Z33_06945 [Candidatus Gottesmanbacteria bacterium RBG_16_52_11]
MKNKEKTALKASDKDELIRNAAALSDKLAQMHVSRYTNPPKNLREQRAMRRKLAVILTLLREKELTHEK